MKRFIVVVFAALAVLALPALASAQAAHTDSNHKAEFNLSVAVVVGSHTLQPGAYKFECRMIEGAHFIVVTAVDDKQELARVPCKAVTLDKKVDLSQFRTVKRGNDSVLTDIRIKGETIAHSVAN